MSANAGAKKGGDVKVAKKERHKLAYTKVEVFRLFKARDLALAIEKSTDPVVQELGFQMKGECERMLKPYCTEQQKIIMRDHEAKNKRLLKKAGKRGTKAKAKR